MTSNIVKNQMLAHYEAIAFNPLLTDAYQLSMAKGINDANNMCADFDKEETFELFFRKNPFKGSFAVAGGMSDALKFISSWKFTEEHELLMRSVYGDLYSDEYYTKLKSLNSLSLSVYSAQDGDLVFADEPLIRISGNSILVQLLETTLLNIIGHATLVATNASRIKLRCPNIKLAEFGCRRAQGSSGALNSSRYSYIGGFDSTSNVLAGALYSIPVTGTHAHSWVMRFIDIEDVPENLSLQNLTDGTTCENFKQYVLRVHSQFEMTTHLGELGAFIQYAYSFPTKFLALVDTYNTLQSGVMNFIAVAIALIELGYKPLGIRLDSGNLAELSIEISKIFGDLVTLYPDFANLTIVASNDLDEGSVNALTKANSTCKVYGIGTNLATSKDQPSLGCVYKLVDRGGVPRIKKSEEVGKTTIPGKKYVFRLFDVNGNAICDVMSLRNCLEGNTILLFDPKKDNSRTIDFVKYECVLKPVLENGELLVTFDNATQEGRERCANAIKVLEEKYTRLESPEKYFVGIDEELYHLTKSLLD